MICPYCQIAGDMSGGTPRGQAWEIRVMHRSCQYKQSCTCQHGQGVAVWWAEA